MTRIKELRLQFGITQKELAKKLNIAQNTLSTWETGKFEPDISALNKLGEIFNVSTDYLLGRDVVSAPADDKNGVWIPVLGQVQAGLPTTAVEHIFDYEQISRDMSGTGEFFALRVKGDSMEPKFTEGDVVIVRKQSTASDGDIVIALVNGDDATIKKIKIRPEGIILTPLNSQYEPMFYNNDEIETLPVTIIGKVVELRAKF